MQFSRCSSDSQGNMASTWIGRESVLVGPARNALGSTSIRTATISISFSSAAVHQTSSVPPWLSSRRLGDAIQSTRATRFRRFREALEPLAETYRYSAPFKGAVLAGVFTEGAITQLKSLGFTVLYFPTESVVKAFGRFGIDASSSESTSDTELKRKVSDFQRLSQDERKRFSQALVKSRQADVRGPSIRWRYQSCDKLSES